MGFTFNCDAPGYMEAAHDLKQLTVQKADKDAQGKLLMMSISFVVFFLFFMVLGYYDERLAFTFYPIILCIMLLETDKISWLKSKPVIIVLIALAWHMYNVLSYGPFS